MESQFRNRAATNPLSQPTRTDSSFSKAAPSRSRTDVPERTHRRLNTASFRHRALPGTHHHHGPKLSHTHRQSARETVQSAIDLKPPISFEHLLRRDRRSPESSRRGSAVPISNKDGSDQDWNFAAQQAEAERKRVKPEDVERVRKQNEEREVELRDSLKKVEDLGMQSTRQLDDTYYSILEKAAALRSTVASLQELAEESRRMREGFETKADKLEKDANKNMDGFGDFQAQEESVDALVSRLANSKTKTDKLNERLEAARKRVETWEKNYHEHRAKRRKQWSITWGSLLGVLVLVLAVLIAKHQRHLAHQLDGVGETLAQAGDVVEDLFEPVAAKLKPSPSEDPYLGELFESIV